MRQSKHDINELFVRRWSPRAMNAEELEEKELFRLFEAARWAPSSFNNQPWRFVYCSRTSDQWKTFLDLLVPFNQTWAKHAAYLVAIVSKNTFDHNNKISKTHSFDTGAAWQNLALQGTFQGLVVHAMTGVDFEKAQKTLNIPKDHTVECIIAIGKPGNKENLPQELQEKEAPNSRKPIQEFIFNESM